MRFRKIEDAIPWNRILAGAETPSAASSLAPRSRSAGASSCAGTRELLWIRVLLSEGKRAEAQAKADALRKAAPQSPAVHALDALLPGAEAAP